jgi:hypothetical protein
MTKVDGEDWKIRMERMKSRGDNALALNIYIYIYIYNIQVLSYTTGNRTGWHTELPIPQTLGHMQFANRNRI